MYKRKRDIDLWCLSDIARFVGRNWHTVRFESTKPDYPSPKYVVSDRKFYWARKDIEKYYSKKK